MASGTVLVTGASTGIGHVTALHLAELGFDAVGAVRKDEDRIWETSNRLADEILAELPPESERLYGRLIEAVRRQTVRIETDSGLEPRVVAEMIGQALTSSRPRARYLVGRDAKLRAPMATILPARVMDRLIGRAIG